jgi:GT2 family glycosyltransferase
MLPRLSIITPSYNQAPYLEQTILSVIEQAYPNVEHLLIDGNSSDGTLDVIKRYEDRLAYWVSEPDRGQSHAVNKALERATGDWIGWLNSDDYYLPGAFEAVVSTVSNVESRVGLVFGRGLRVGPEGLPIGPFWPRDPAFNRDALLYGVDYILQPTAFIRREAWKTVGPLDERLRYCMDYDLWLRLSAKFEVGTVAHTVAASREHPESKTLTGGIERWYEISQMIARHTGGAITPGVILYLLQTLRALTQSGHTAPLFGSSFQAASESLWREAFLPLTTFSANGDWLPTVDRARPEGTDPIEWMIARIKPDKPDREGAASYSETPTAELLKQIHELTAALRYWEAQAAVLLEQADASAKIRYLGGRIGHAARRRLGNVVRRLGPWLHR